MSDRLEEIRKRADAATPGPWKNVGYNEAKPGMYHYVSIEASRSVFGPTEVVPLYGQGVEDATFIAHAREDIPWLLAEVERLKSAPCPRCEALGKTPKLVRDVNELLAEFSEGKE